MLFNVSTLLGEPVGERRRHTLDGASMRLAEPDAPGAPAEGKERDSSRPVWGELRLMRTGTGVLVSANLTIEAELECARCLTRLWRPIEIAFDEEFVPERDPLTGLAPADVDPDTFRIDASQHLDLSEAIRQYERAVLPISPLCRAECAGLCPHCGADRNEGSCGCAADDNDSRWAALAALAGELSDGMLRQKEDSRGAPEA